MATLSHFTYNIRNIARAGQGNSDDERLTIRNIEFWITYWRAQGLNQFTEYGKDINPQLVQDLGIIPLVEVDKTDANCPDVRWGCTVKKVTIPKFVGFPENRAISFMGKIDKREPFIFGNADTEYYKSNTRFGNLMTRTSIIGDSVYLELSDKDADLEYMNIRGVFEDPTKVDQYATAGCKPKCFDKEIDEYPLPFELYVYVLENILSKELNWTEQAVNDELNNARKDNEKLR